MSKMTPHEAIMMAKKWTADMKDEGISTQGHINPTDIHWVMVKTLVDLVEQQRKDVDEITAACQLLLRNNKELTDELRRSEKTG
jgi:hypothetical protein